MSDIMNSLKKPYFRNNKFNIIFEPVGSAWGNNKDLIANVFHKCVANSNLPDLVDTPMEEYIGENWKIVRGKRETFIISIALHAIVNPDIYRFFAQRFIDFERVYSNEQHCNIIAEIFHPSDMETPKAVYTFKNCILSGVSGLSLDYSAENSLLEFSLTFKSGIFETKGDDTNSLAALPAKAGRMLNNIQSPLQKAGNMLRSPLKSFGL